MVKKKLKKDKKLHNFDKKLYNSHELDLSWQETVDLQPEDENEDGSEIYYFVDQDGNIRSTLSIYSASGSAHIRSKEVV